MRTHYSLGTEHHKYISTSVTIKTARVAFQGDLPCHVRRRNQKSLFIYMPNGSNIKLSHPLEQKSHKHVIAYPENVNQLKKKTKYHGTLKLCRMLLFKS